MICFAVGQWESGAGGVCRERGEGTSGERWEDKLRGGMLEGRRALELLVSLLEVRQGGRLASGRGGGAVGRELGGEEA